MWSMRFSPRMARQLTERCLEVRISALPYARLAGLLSHTEVNDAHLVAAHSYLTAPVTLPPPTSDNLLRQGARARVCRTHNCTSGGTCVLHSSVTLPPREVMRRSLSQVHCRKRSNNVGFGGNASSGTQMWNLRKISTTARFCLYGRALFSSSVSEIFRRAT